MLIDWLFSHKCLTWTNSDARGSCEIRVMLIEFNFLKTIVSEYGEVGLQVEFDKDINFRCGLQSWTQFMPICCFNYAHIIISAFLVSSIFLQMSKCKIWSCYPNFSCYHVEINAFAICFCIIFTFTYLSLLLCILGV